MSDEIKVYVVDRGRKNLYLRYVDPLTSKPVEKSAKTSKRSQATKAAGAWEDELRNGRYQKPGKMAWDAFREYYSANALPGLASRTADTYESSLNVFEEKCKPAKLANVTTARITEFVTSLRNDLAAEATIAHHLRHLKAAMRWAHKQGLLVTVPTFTMPKRVKGAKMMRGRPITGEEFDRMIENVENVVDNAAAPSWKFYLRGLWESGLRLSESLTLSWTDTPGAIVVDLTGRRPMLRIPAEVEKGNRDRVMPMTPQFAALLSSVPEADRWGRVFKLLAANGTLFNVSTCEVSRVVASIGKKAGIVVDERTKRVKATSDTPAHDAIVRKFASAHDLRRAFGKRWATKLKPTQLRELMRHASINTTLAYYVGEDAEETADALWAGFGDNLGDTSERDEKSGDGRRENNALK
jgi:integrase